MGFNVGRERRRERGGRERKRGRKTGGDIVRAVSIRIVQIVRKA